MNYALEIEWERIKDKNIEYDIYCCKRSRKSFIDFVIMMLLRYTLLCSIAAWRGKYL
jgi:hypothetical protein